MVRFCLCFVFIHFSRCCFDLELDKVVSFPIQGSEVYEVLPVIVTTLMYQSKTLRANEPEIY